MKKATIALGPQTAAAVWPAAQDTAPAILNQLGLPAYGAVLAVVGSATSLDAQLLPRLAQLFGRGVARATLATQALVVDGATQAGMMQLMGEAVAAQGHRTPLLGVAPADLVTYPYGPATGTPLEPNHSHFVLTPGAAWGAETPTMFALLEALANPGEGGRRPTAVLLVGGGAVARTEVVRAVRLGLPIVALSGTGGLADELAAAWPTRATLPDDPTMAEILADGRVRFYSVRGSVQGLEHLLLRELGDDQVLRQAWETFTDYDFNANRQQRKFDRLQRAIIGLGVATPLLVIVQQLYAPRVAAGTGPLPLSDLWHDQQYGWWALYQALILLPITLTLLVAVANQFKQGNKWLLLRAGAESIKREIYRYRARAMYYADNAESNLAQRIEDITRRTMHTEVSSSSLRPYDKRQGFPPYSGPQDDGLVYLTPARYVEVRLNDQHRYFRGKAVKLERQFYVLSWLTFLIGAAGTYLAAIGQQVWITLTTASVTGVGAYLAYRQVETTLTKYNQAATDLANVRAWWQALPPETQTSQATTDSLVEHTEQVLQLDLDGWVQNMQNALAELHKNQARSAEREEARMLAALTPPPLAEDEPGADQSTANAAAGSARSAALAGAGAGSFFDDPAPADGGEEEEDDEIPPGGPRMRDHDDEFAPGGPRQDESDENALG